MSLGFEFAPIDVSISTHPKAYDAGVEAMGLWLWGMAHARRDKTKGLLHRRAVLVAWGGKRNIMLAKRLVEAGLWVALENGDWEIFNFETKAPGRSTSSTERMRRLRERRAKHPGDASRDVTSDASPVTLCSLSVSPSASVSPPDLASPPDEPVEPVTGIHSRKVLGLDGEGGAAWEAWRQGIGRATGAPVSELGRFDKSDLVAFANAHSGGLRGELLMEWIARTAEAFARANDDGYGLTPKRCKAWLDGGRKARASPGRGIVQSADNRAWKLPGGEF